MAIQYVFIKVTGTSASVSTTMTDAIYDAGGYRARGYYRCIDVGSVAGEKLTREDMKFILDKEKSIWGDATSRSTLLYWNSVQNCFVINFCGWASKNFTETQTDGSVHTDGIFLRECELRPSAFTSTTFNTFGTLVNTAGAFTKLVDKQQPNLGDDIMSAIFARGLSITGDSVPDQNVPVAQRLQSYFFHKAWGEAGSNPFNNVMFFRSGNRLYANNTINTIGGDAYYLAKKLKNNEVDMGIKNGRHFIAPTKTQFSPESITDALPSGSFASAITSSGKSLDYGAAADSICIDSTNLSPMHTTTNGDSNTPITSISYAPNTGDDPFSLLPVNGGQGKSVNCTFWIPTLQGATATSKNDSTRVLRFSVCSNSYKGSIGIGAFHRNFSYTDANQTNLEAFVSDEKHRVCLFVKNSESPHSFKYSWTQPLTLTFKYRNPNYLYVYQSGSQTNMFAGVHNQLIVWGAEWLQLDPLNIMQEFNLDYSSAGATDGLYDIYPARTKNGLCFKSSTLQSSWYNAKLGGADNIDYVHGGSYEAKSSVSSNSFSFGVTYLEKSSVSAVYPTSG